MMMKNQRRSRWTSSVLLALAACALLSVVVTGGDNTPTPTTASSSSSPSKVFPSEDDQLFMKWLANQGGTFSGKGVYSFVAGGGRSSGEGEAAASDNNDKDGSSRGVFAKGNVTNGDAVFTLPLKAALLVPSPRAGPLLNRFAGVNPEWALAAMLIREMRLGVSSPRDPFLRSLRKNPPPGSLIPRLSIDAAAALEGTFAADYLRVWERAAEEGYKAVVGALVTRFPAAFPPEHYTQEAFRAALAIVHAGGVRLPAASVPDTDTLPGGGSQSAGFAALVPVAHLLPHDPRGSEPCVAAAADGTLVVRWGGASLNMLTHSLKGDWFQTLTLENNNPSILVSKSAFQIQPAPLQCGRRRARRARSWAATAVGLCTSNHVDP
jgi:hypothetical protein